MGKLKRVLRYVFWNPGFWRIIPDSLILLASITDLYACHHAVKQENWEDAKSYIQMSDDELRARLTRLRIGELDDGASTETRERDA